MTANKDTAVTQYDRCVKYDRIADAVAERRGWRLAVIEPTAAPGVGAVSVGGVGVSFLCCSGGTSLGL